MVGDGKIGGGHVCDGGTSGEYVVITDVVSYGISDGGTSGEYASYRFQSDGRVGDERRPYRRSRDWIGGEWHLHRCVHPSRQLHQ